MNRVRVPYLAPLRVVVDLDSETVEAVELDGAEAVQDRAGAVYALDDGGRLLAPDVPDTARAYELAESLPWPAWTITTRSEQ